MRMISFVQTVYHNVSFNYVLIKKRIKYDKTPTIVKTNC